MDESDVDRKEQHRVDTIGQWDPPEADWAAEYDWTRYRGPAAYPCPGAWVLDEPEGLAYSWLWFPEIGDDYGTESSAFDDLEYSSIDSYREARAFLIGEDVAESLRDEEIEWTLSIDNVDVFVRRDLDQDELMGAVAEALSRYPDDDWRDVTPTAGSPPPEVLRERELEQRREENESLDEFVTDGGQPDGGIDREPYIYRYRYPPSSGSAIDKLILPDSGALPTHPDDGDAGKTTIVTWGSDDGE